MCKQISMHANGYRNLSFLYALSNGHACLFVWHFVCWYSTVLIAVLNVCIYALVHISDYHEDFLLICGFSPRRRFVWYKCISCEKTHFALGSQFNFTFFLSSCNKLKQERIPREFAYDLDLSEDALALECAAIANKYRYSFERFEICIWIRAKCRIFFNMRFSRNFVFFFYK